MQLADGDGNGDTDQAAGTATKLEGGDVEGNGDMSQAGVVTSTLEADQDTHSDEEAVWTQLTPAIGDEIVLRLSDLSEDELISDWVNQGYSVLGRTESGDIFFRFTGVEESPSNVKSPKDKEQFQVRPPSVFVEVEEVVEDEEDSDSETVFKGSGSSIPLDWSARNYVDSLKVDDQNTFNVSGTNQQAYVQVCFRSACDRSDAKHTTLHLEMLDATFGVENCNNSRNHRGHFIYFLEVTATPSAKWRSKVIALNAQPADSPETIDHEIQNTRGITVGWDPKGLGGNIAGTWQKTTVTASKSQNFRWASKVVFGKTWSVKWTWRFETWKEGQLFVPEAPGKLKCGPLPELPFNPEAFQQNQIGSEAQWTVPSTELEGFVEAEWDITVEYSTVSIDQKTFILNNHGLGYVRPPIFHMPSPSIAAKITQTLPPQVTSELLGDVS